MMNKIVSYTSGNTSAKRKENKVSTDCLIHRSASIQYSHAPSKSDYNTLVLILLSVI